MIPYLAKIPIRTGERGESRYILINDLKSFSREDRRKTAYRYVSMYSEKEELDEEERREFRRLMRQFVNGYAFLARIIPF